MSALPAELPPPESEAGLRLRQLEAQLADAEQAVRARDELLSIAAHELRTPMNALALQLAALERRAQREGTPRLADELRRAERMLRRYVRRATVLLDVARLNSGHFTIAPEPCALGPIVESVLDAHAEEAAFSRVGLVAEVELGLAGVWDAHAIEQVIANLVSNGIKHGGGSPVVVRAAQDGEDAVCIVVADRGPGIAEEHRARVFGKFERAVAGGPMRTGFGLGLWIAQQLVVAHGGSIAIDTPPGGGTAFRVRLPRVAAPTPRLPGDDR